MVIIVEGPNNVGKTTFINKFLKQFPKFIVEHNNEITPNNYEYYKLCLKVNNADIIYDRLHVGEMIYPKLRGRKGGLTPTEFKRLCREYGAAYVFIDADFNFIKKACDNKHEVFNLTEVAEEREQFRKYAKIVEETGVPVFYVHNHINNCEYIDQRHEELVFADLYLEINKNDCCR